MPLPEAARLSRRHVTALLAAAVAAPGALRAEYAPPRRAAFYAAVGADLVLYRADEEALTLTREGVMRVPQAVQYAWPHPSKPLLYVAFSDRYTVKDGQNHGVAVYGVDQRTGRLTPFGEPIRLDNRPVNITLDPSGQFMLLAYNAPSALTVHWLGPDGTIGDRIAQHEPVEAGIYAHQVRVAPSGALVVLPTRGNDPTPTTAEDPGALKVFHFVDGQLTHEASVRNGDGLGFGPRHVDFHPTRPFMYVSMERNNQLLTYGAAPDGITAAPLFTKSTLFAGGDSRLPVQFVGPIHLHPNGRFVYLANRSDGTVDLGGRKVHGPGENSVAVFSLDPATGEPTLIQTADTQSFHCRTFSIHPDGRMLVTAAIEPMGVRDGNQVREVPAGLSVFAVGDDGRLALARKYDVDVGKDWMFWCGMVPLR